MGNARNIFLGYNRDEYENRFSTLTDTHLLKAQQLLGRKLDERNQMLADAQVQGLSVGNMVATIKQRNEVAEKESATARRATLGPRPAGYIHGDGEKALVQLPDRSVGQLRLRWPHPENGFFEGARVLASDGILVVDCPSIGEFTNVMRQVPKSTGLCLLHSVIAVSATLKRDAHRGLPYVDRYRLLLLLGSRYTRRHCSADETLDIPAAEAEAEAMILKLPPETGLVVDIGTGCLSTALWAEAQQREYLAVEPNDNAHAQGLPQLANSRRASGEPGASPTPESAPDYWPTIPDEHRDRATIDGVGWDELSCCDRTKIAAIRMGKQRAECPVCHEKLKVV